MKVLIIACLITASTLWGSQPNIVLLFSDDAGYADFGFQGSEHFRTPHLDKLAASGIRLSQFYVSGSTCGPSRAGMLSGRYQQRFGFEENNVPSVMSENSQLVGEEMGLPLHVKTIGNYLQDLGYRTAVFGKWHMGEADRYNPTKRGFDEFYGFRGGARSFFPYETRQNTGRMMERGFGQFEEHEGYLTDAFADEVCRFIENNKDQPFFAYVSFNAVHTPMEPDPMDADQFPMLKGTRRKVAQMTLSLDRACGRIIDQLSDSGLLENTLIIFTNDNGGPMDRNGSSNYPLAGVKATQLEGGIRVPCIVAWQGVLSPGQQYDYPLNTLDFAPTFIRAAGGNSESMEDLDGIDMVPFLKGEEPDRPHQALYWKMETRAAIRDGDWKLMRFPDRPPHLFNIPNDPGEQQNLAGKYPERVEDLYEKLFEWEMTLARPLFMLRRQEENWSSERFDQFRKPPSKDY